MGKIILHLELYPIKMTKYGLMMEIQLEANELRKAIFLEKELIHAMSAHIVKDPIRKEKTDSRPDLS